MQITTIASWVLLVSKALQSYGIDSHKLLVQVGLDPTQLTDPNARYSYSSVTELWKLAVEETGDPCFGLKVVEYWHPTTFHALGFSWMASATLKEALQRVVRYIRIANSATEAELKTISDAYQFTLKGVAFGPIPADVAFDASMAVIVHMCRESAGASFNPQRLSLQRIRPDKDCEQEFLDYFKCDIDFDAQQDCLYLPKQSLEAELPTGNAELALANDQIVNEYLSHLDSTSIAFRVKTKLIEQLSSGNITEDVICGLLNVSLRTLQRKLKAEGVTFKELLEETRRELATQYIGNSRLSINEVTYMLGFAEPSNFTRAFKRWHGMPPSEYRINSQ